MPARSINNINNISLCLSLPPSLPPSLSLSLSPSLSVSSLSLSLSLCLCLSLSLSLSLSPSEKSSLELLIILLEDNKLGLSLLNISEFVEILDVLLISREEGANVNKLTKFKIPGENSSQKLFRSVKKVNKLECSQNLSSTSCFDVSLVQNFLSFFLFLLIIFCDTCSFSIVSLEVFSPPQLVDSADNCYITLNFSFLLFFYDSSI